MSDRESKAAVPSLIPDVGERASYRRGGHRRPAPGGGGSGSAAVIWLLSLLLLLAVSVMGAGGYWLWDNLQRASVRLIKQDKALESVRRSLSSTNIDLSQHNQGLSDQLDALTTNQAAAQKQLRVLSSQLAGMEQGHRQLVDRQQQLVERQQSVAEQHQQLASRQQGQEQQWQSQVESLATQYQALREEISTLMVHTEALSEKSTRDSGDLSASLGTVRDGLRVLRGQLKQLSESVVAFDRRIELNEEWIEGINAYRRQVNDRLFRMQQLLVNRVGAPADTPTDDAGLQAVTPTDTP